MNLKSKVIHDLMKTILKSDTILLLKNWKVRIKYNNITEYWLYKFSSTLTMLLGGFYMASSRTMRADYLNKL